MVLAFGAEAQSVPQYKDYPAKPFKGARAAVDVSPPDAWNYRSVLRKGAKEPINFAGRYVFTSWGVGRGCETGAAIDVSTGRVTFFPYNACFWREKDPPFIVETGSRLFISTGNLGEDGPRGAHFFEFTGREFRYLMTNPFKEDAPRAEQELAFERGTQGMIFQDDPPSAKLPALSMADMLPADMVLANGRPVDDLSTLLAQEALVREDAVFGLTDYRAYEGITAAVGEFMKKPETARQFLSFYLAAAVGYPLMAPGGSDYIVFYNPVADVALLTSWTKDPGDVAVTDARLVPGERVFADELRAAEPRWFLQDDKPTALKAQVSRYLKEVATGSSAAIASVEQLFREKVNVDDVRVAEFRILMNAIGTNLEGMPCGKELREKGTNLRGLVAGSQATNIRLQDSIELFPAGGYKQQTNNNMFFVAPRTPSTLFVAIADTNNGCRIIYTDGIPTIPLD
jgi:hypothetical protein